VANFDVIIPARDEEPTVAGVVRAAKAAYGVGHVFVVDDGSSDGTAEAAARAGAGVLSRPPGAPGSKARALALGVAASAAHGRSAARSSRPSRKESGTASRSRS
jgi:glycosyltransferase involved in cell wall biosynthesis